MNDMNRDTYEKRVEVAYQQRKRDRKRLLEVKKHVEKAWKILSQIKEIKV